MLTYFIVFTVIGIVLGAALKDVEKAAPVILGIAVVWGQSVPLYGGLLHLVNSRLVFIFLHL